MNSKQGLTVSGEQGNGGTLSARTAGSTNTVNIVLRIVRVVIVKHMSDVANIFKHTYVSKQSKCGKQGGLGRFSQSCET